MSSVFDNIPHGICGCCGNPVLEPEQWVTSDGVVCPACLGLDAIPLKVVYSVSRRLFDEPVMPEDAFSKTLIFLYEERKKTAKHPNVISLK